jgi:two-component system, cell cycle sensor histidine kinase and response regulator CckA
MTLRAFLLSWWRPPDFDDLEDRRVAALTLPLATIFAVCVALWVPAAVLIYRFSLWPMLAALFALAYASAAVLVRARRAEAGAQLLVTTAFLSTTAGVAAAGIAGPVPSLYALSVIAAGLLLRTRLALALALAGIACSAAIGFAQARSWLPAPATHADPVRDLLIHGTIVMLSLAIVWLAVRAMREYDARLAESGARFRALTENAPDLIAELDADGTVLYASPGYARVLGYGEEELRRQRLETIVHPDDLSSARGVLGRILAGNGDIVSLRLRDRAGSWRWFDFEGAAFDDAGGARRVVTFGRDVTETRELQEQLQRAQRLEALGRLAAEVAHDFNNNLTVILGAAEWLRDELPKRSALGERVAEIEEAGRRSAAITQQLLAFGRRQPFHPRVVDLNHLLAGIESVLRRLLPENIAIDGVHTAEASRVRIDPSQLEQALLNLALNARDAMPDGGTLTLSTANVLLDPEFVARIGQLSAGRYVVVAVSDTGSGMEPEVAAHAFEPFFTTKPTGKGSGLGLSTVHGIVRQSRGHTEIDTRPGEGTTVKIFLPRVDQEPELAELPPLEAPDLRGNETVLLVEDAELLRVHLRQILESSGYRVLEAADGGEALSLGSSHPEIDAVITDLMLPVLGGGELARRLREARPGLPVVFVTGNTENGTAARELPDGALVVRKPFTARELLRLLRRALTPP